MQSLSLAGMINPSSRTRSEVTGRAQTDAELRDKPAGVSPTTASTPLPCAYRSNRWRKHRILAACLVGLTLFWSGPSIAAEDSAPADRGESEQTEAENTDPESDTPEIDVEGSIEGATAQRGWSVSGDLRFTYSYTDEEGRDGSSDGDGEFIGRFRIGGSWSFNRYLRAVTRVAGACSSDDCSGDFLLDSSLPARSGIQRGDSTLDELFLHWFRLRHFDLAIGRMQTKFVTQGGVFSKSLDRNDSNHVNVTWTDGIHGTLRHRRGWVSNLILQANRNRGSGGVRRGPLNFEDEDSHLSYFLAFENTEPWGYVVQRAFDVSYLPRSLQKDETAAGRIEDYWGVVGRLAARFPLGEEEMGLILAGETGFAPETPTRGAKELEGSGDTDGLAWNIVASLMNLHPGHSVGLNYGRADPGWLISPQYRENEELVEVRYLWEKSPEVTIELRARRREEINQLTTASQKREVLDFYARMTWRFTLKRQ